MTKISSISPLGTWEYNGETMHSFNVSLENGLTGKVNTKTADRWKVGDQVEATEYKDKQGNNCLKLSKPNSGGSRGGYNNMSPEKEKRITFLSCLSSAASFHAQSSVTPEQVIDTAKKFANAAYSLDKTPTAQPAPQPQQASFAANDDDLPF